MGRISDLTRRDAASLARDARRFIADVARVTLVAAGVVGVLTLVLALARSDAMFPFLVTTVVLSCAALGLLCCSLAMTSPWVPLGLVGAASCVFAAWLALGLLWFGLASDNLDDGLYAVGVAAVCATLLAQNSLVLPRPKESRGPGILRWMAAGAAWVLATVCCGMMLGLLEVRGVWPLLAEAGWKVVLLLTLAVVIQRGVRPLFAGVEGDA